MNEENRYINTLKSCGGYYKTPQGGEKYLGPLVGYAATYEEGKQFVGDEYANFRFIERNGGALRIIATDLFGKIAHAKPVAGSRFGFCGAPEGGKALASVMAALSGRTYIFPEKKKKSDATAGSRDFSTLEFASHEPMSGENFIIVEDVCNNFSTTLEMIKLIRGYGAEVVGIACFLNRSMNWFEEIFVGGLSLPVISLVQKPIPEYRQDHPKVIYEVTRGNVAWKPKERWSELQSAMAANP